MAPKKTVVISVPQPVAGAPFAAADKLPRPPKPVVHVNDLKAKHFILAENEPLPLSVSSFRKRFDVNSRHHICNVASMPFHSGLLSIF